MSAAATARCLPTIRPDMAVGCAPPAPYLTFKFCPGDFDHAAHHGHAGKPAEALRRGLLASWLPGSHSAQPCDVGQGGMCNCAQCS